MQRIRSTRMFCVNQSIKPLADAKMSISSLASRQSKRWGDEVHVHAIAPGDSHYLEPLALAVYWTCRGNPCSTSDSMTAIPAVLQGVSLTFWFSEWADESLDRLHRIELLHTT